MLCLRYLNNYTGMDSETVNQLGLVSFKGNTHENSCHRDFGAILSFPRGTGSVKAPRKTISECPYFDELD
ncbi:hypothetical protein Y032_0043g775 [Ancylostoma ceylanicum]|uniref:Uncharacterized protein n=1 Tax=Ancylostoma ceylanicum TaxID=53326 RepID=A0A016UEK2_9BILA|nr:hypothetical protein Y032_0043g775 [Ancylostoma ceylanicum]